MTDRQLRKALRKATIAAIASHGATVARRRLRSGSPLVRWASGAPRPERTPQ